MSSAVHLPCRDCHTSPHPDEFEPEEMEEVGFCQQCHDDIHVEQQKLVLGIHETADGPSPRFMGGLSCRSCHGDRPGDVADCQDCHEPAFGRILEWWLAGLSLRGGLVRQDIDRAHERLGDVPAAAPRLTQAEDLLSLVEGGGGVHNLEFSDWIFHRSVELVDLAYLDGTALRPTPPDLGDQHLGYCTYCHYRSIHPDQLEGDPPAGHERYRRRR